MAWLEKVVMDPFFGGDSAVRRLICDWAALRSSSRHLWAERRGRSGSVSQLSAPPPQTHARAFEARSCLSHPGENHLDRNKMKSLYLTSWQPFNRTIIYCWFPFFMFCGAMLPCKHYYVEQNAINTCCYKAAKWKLGHLRTLSFGEIRTCWTDVCFTVGTFCVH